MPSRAHEIEEILRGLGFERIRRSSSGWTALCRFHGEKHPSFSIGDNGLWLCHGCGEKGNLRQLQQRLGGYDPGDWRMSLKLSRAQLVDRKERRHAARINLPEDFSEYALPGEVPAQISRRLKWETIKAFRLGSCHLPGPNADRCIIPIYYKGACVGYHGRALRDDMEPRYYNPSGFEIKDYLFNYDGCKKKTELIVVEGAFNAMSMVEKGFPNTVATFGTQFRPAQIEKLFSLAPTAVTICFDRDRSKVRDGKEVGMAGQRAAGRLGALISDLLHVWVMPLPFEKDPNDLSADILRACHAKRFPYERIARIERIER